MTVETGPIRARYQSRGADKAAGDARKVENALKAAAGGVSGVAGAMSGASVGIGVGIAALGAAALAARELMQVTTRIGREIHELGRLGGAFSPIATTFERLASPDLLGRLHDITGWLVDEQRLQQESVQVLRSRMLTEEQWVEGLGAVVRLAQDAGEDVDRMVEAFGNIASGGSVRALGRLGLNVVALNDAVLEAGESTSTLRGRTIMMQGAMEQFSELLDGPADNAATNYADATDRLTNRMQAYRLEVARAFAEDERLIEVMAELEEQFVSLQPDAEDLGTAIADMAIGVADFVAATAEGIGPLMSFGAAMQRMYAWMLERPGDPFASWRESLLRSAAEMERIAPQIAAQAREARERIARGMSTGEWRRAEEEAFGAGWETGEAPGIFAGGLGPLEEGGGRGRGGAGGGRSLAAEARRGPRLRGLGGAGTSLATGLLLRRVEAEDVLEGLGDVMSAEEAHAAMLADREAAQARYLDAKRLELEIQEQIADKEDEANAQRLRSIQDYIGIASQAGSLVAGALQEHINSREQEIRLQLELGKISERQAEQQLRALETERKVLGSIKAAVNFVDAAAEIAKAAGSYPDVAGMIIHGLSAAGHIVAGSMALAQLGGTASPPAGLAAPSAIAHRPDYGPERRQRETQGAATASIMLVSLSSAAMAREIAKAERHRQRIGMPAGMYGWSSRR